jgi:TRAP-type C4-dicarboxylate transport system permease small subunit
MRLARIGHALGYLPEAACAGLGFALLVLTLLTVIARYSGWFVVVWAEELIRVAFLWLAFLGGALGVKYQRHFRMSMLIDRSSERVRRSGTAVANGSMVLLGAFFILFGGQLVMFTAASRSALLSIPLGAVNAAVPVAGALMVLYALLNLRRDLVVDTVVEPGPTEGLDGQSS